MQEEIQSVSGQSWPAKVKADGVIGMCRLASASELVGLVEDAAVGGVLMAWDSALDGGSGDFLPAVWSFEGTVHWLTTRNPLTDEFQSMRVGSLSDALKRASELAARGFDVYLSPAEFALGARTRKAQDVACVRGIWLDIDVSAAKAEQGQGYTTRQEAMAAVKAFCVKAGLPRPTHVVGSGRGWHVYWVVDAPIEPTQWLIYAKMFKALTKSLGLLADPTRTADIASLMRVPGTFNFKDKANPRAVELTYASATLIEKSVMLRAIDAAHARHCEAGKPQTPALLKMQVSRRPGTGVLPKQWLMVPAELTKLASALCVLSPDCDEPTWSLKFIAPMAHAARENPQYALDLCNLARNWSNGSLRGLACKAWTTPGGGGFTGEQYFEKQWKRFLNDNFAGGCTLGTVYFHAKKAGWQE